MAVGAVLPILTDRPGSALLRASYFADRASDLGSESSYDFSTARLELYFALMDRSQSEWDAATKIQNGPALRRVTARYEQSERDA